MTEEQKKKKTIKIKDGKTELEVEKGKPEFGAPDYEEYEKKMKKKKEMDKAKAKVKDVLDVASQKAERLLSADEIIEEEMNEKRQNKEQALLVYFQRINLYRFHKQEHDEFVALFAKLTEEPGEVHQAYWPISPDTGLRYSKELLALKCQEIHMALRIEARKIEMLKQDLFNDFGLDDAKLEEEWNAWFK